jgi:large subunit ribosomal protein L21e
MAKGKKIRTKGKVKLSEYFKEIEDGSRVAVVKELSEDISFPARLQGRSGTVTGNRGTHKVVKLKDGNKEKTFIIHPVHLKKL